jgi:hypothetical protein
MPSDTQPSSALFSRAETLLRDCAAGTMSPSTQLYVAFDAIYLCCMLVTHSDTETQRGWVHLTSDTVVAALDFLVSARAGDSPLPAESVDLVLRLMLWCFSVDHEDMPCTPAQAISLAMEVISRTRNLGATAQ